MTTPISPDSDKAAFTPSDASSPETGHTAAYSGKNPMDPAGIWYRFFQQLNPSQPVTPQDVKAFQMGLMRWFNLLIAQENRAWKRTMDDMKKSWQN